MGELFAPKGRRTTSFASLLEHVGGTRLYLLVRRRLLDLSWRGLLLLLGLLDFRVLGSDPIIVVDFLNGI